MYVPSTVEHTNKNGTFLQRYDNHSSSEYLWVLSVCQTLMAQKYYYYSQFGDLNLKHRDEYALSKGQSWQWDPRILTSAPTLLNTAPP